MSNRYKGGVISATPPTTTGGESGTASGAWTLEQQMQLTAAGLWPVAPPDPSLFIENLFNTWLYTGNDTTQVITNGIDLATKGGLVWAKSRSGAANHVLVDTAQGTSSGLLTNGTDAAGSSGGFTSFNTTGFTFGGGAGVRNNNGTTYAAWTFREQAKFFDIVTYTGDGIIGKTVAHNLGSVPGCIIVKRTNTSGTNWRVYHRSLGATYSLALNTAAAATTLGGIWADTEPTSTVFSVGDNTGVNGSGDSYVAYLFAHDAGGFGLTGTDNVISCGSISIDVDGNGSANLGYEPQWVLAKDITNSTQRWLIFDTMRGFPNAVANGTDAVVLAPNTTAAEAGFGQVGPTATGWGTNAGQLNASSTYIYIAIRRGPMKVPTDATKVFSPVLTSSSSETVNTVGFTPDMQLIKQTGNAVGTNAVDRLRNVSTRYQFNDGKFLLTSSTAAEASNYSTQYWNNTGFSTPFLTAGISTIYWTFRRAPSFFDEVCYTGTGSANTTIPHNLGVAPELIITKIRSISGYDWWTYHAALGQDAAIALNLTSAVTTGVTGYWGTTAQSSTNFYVGSGNNNRSGQTLVAYLFATCAGVSKVGSYTGTATTKQIDCGFTAGARFVLIKRTDSTGDWYVWDTARGIVSGNDPYLLLNSTAAEVTNTDYIDTYSAGFEISSTAPAAINASGGTYIFLAIA